MSETNYIYTLTDPRDGSIRYVGRTINPVERYKQHLPPSWYTSGDKRDWLIELRNLGLKPTFNVIDQAETRSEASAKETQWIHDLTDAGAILVNSVCAKQREWDAYMAKRAQEVEKQYKR